MISRWVARGRAFVLPFGVMALAVAPGSRQSGTGATSLMGDVAAITRSSDGAWHVTFEGDTNAALRPIDVLPTKIPKEFVGTVDPDWFNGSPPKRGDTVRFYAADVNEKRLIAAVEVIESGAARPWYVRRYFDLTPNPDRRKTLDYSEGKLYAMTGGVLSRYNAATSQQQYLWVRDHLKNILGYYESERVARDIFVREGGQKFETTFSNVRALVRAHGNEDALVKGPPFMPRSPKDNYVGGLPVFPLQIVLRDRDGTIHPVLKP